VKVTELLSMCNTVR